MRRRALVTKQEKEHIAARQQQQQRRMCPCYRVGSRSHYEFMYSLSLTHSMRKLNRPRQAGSQRFAKNYASPPICAFLSWWEFLPRGLRLCCDRCEIKWWWIMHARQRQTLDGCLASVRFEFQKHTLHRAHSTKSGAALVNFVVISRQNRGAHKNSNGPHVRVCVCAMELWGAPNVYVRHWDRSRVFTGWGLIRLAFLSREDDAMLVISQVWGLAAHAVTVQCGCLAKNAVSI